MTLPIYDPEVSYNPIYCPRNGKKPYLRYNHDVDIVRFQGKFLASWNANETGAEGVPGQFNFLSVSEDFIHWSTPVKLFTAAAGCRNPVESDNQWQPAFINWRDETLFCAWCDYKARRTFVAHSSDGLHWENVEVPAAPPELEGQVVGFPTNHGLLTSDGAMLFPASLPYVADQYVVGDTRYAAHLISRDGGKSWHWSRPAEAVGWEELGEDPERLPGAKYLGLWEPMLFEQGNGRIGMLIRNSSSQDNRELDPFMKPHWMILYAESADGGESWPKCRPVEVDSIICRNYAVSRTGGPDTLLMVMNDWVVNLPSRIDQDRYFLSLYASPVCEPDLLLPGPVVQPAGGRAFYPNGFAHDGKLYLAYTYPNSIMGAVVQELPDFSGPFLMPRGGRTGLIVDRKCGVARFGHRWATLGVMLTESQTRADAVTVSGELELFYRREEDFPLLTVGGKTRDGGTLLTEWCPERAQDLLVFRDASGEKLELAVLEMRKAFRLAVTLERDRLLVRLDGETVLDRPGRVLRKFAFGGLYETPEWPVGRAMVQEVRLKLDSVEVSAR